MSQAESDFETPPETLGVDETDEAAESTVSDTPPGIRFSLGGMLLLLVIAAVAFGWWNDRQALMARIAALEFDDSPWGTGQVIGPPNTAGSGDLRTAWAASTQDAQPEWLILEYGKPIRPASVQVHETFNPGALNQVSVFDPEGKEVVVWRGVDPTGPDKDRGVSTIPVSTTFDVRRIKLYLDSPKVSGWNEIDAVGLVSDKGRVHWATDAAASSSFGKNRQLPSLDQGSQDAP
ncbi:MAG: hypothetical protein AAFU85_17640 [Planctomycetota bacterium]